MLWGKNQFNSTFPLSLCLYMRDQKIDPVSVQLINGKLRTNEEVWKMGKIVGFANQSPYYEFEKPFSPYAKLSRNEVDSIDLIVRIDNVQRIPLEVKLTVVPDSTTAGKPKNVWAPEMVMRPVSSAHAMMGLASSLRIKKNLKIKRSVINALKTGFNGITDWDNVTEIITNSESIKKSLAQALALSENIQKPFLVQPIWRTQGQSLKLCNQCFDVFVWSDVAVMAIPLQEHSNSSTMTRPLREIARHVRSLYEVLQTGDYDYSSIYKGMALNKQTDKSFSIPGNSSFRYLQHERLKRPILHKRVLQKIVLNGGQNKLKPERRFDAAVQAHMKT